MTGDRPGPDAGAQAGRAIAATDPGARVFRVTVRGVFHGLDTAQREELLADAAAHDMLYATYLPEGHLSYDIAARPAFSFRFLESGRTEADLPAAVARAEAAAAAWLTARGYGYRRLRAQAEDLSQAPLGARRRREARRGR